MKKAGFFTTLLVILAITVVSGTSQPVDPSSHAALTSPAAAMTDTPMAADPVPGDENDPDARDAVLSEVPIPSPSTLLLIGSGLIGLIIYRHKFKDQK